MDLSIELITRFRSPMLYDRMLRSAKDNADGPYRISAEDGGDDPKVAATYNRLGLASGADILAFVEDDVEFLEKGWDSHLKDIFVEFKPDILGVVGSKKYEGGHVFDAGNEYGVGMIAGNNGVRILSRKSRYEPAMVVDGLAMFISRPFFRKNQFDEAFDGLFYYDVDLCLRSDKVGVTRLLLKHSKPARRRRSK